MRQLEELIFWRRMDVPGHDACALWVMESGWCLAGTAIFVLAGQPCHLAYEVNCDPTWRTRSAQVTGCMGRRVLELSIVAVSGERWQLNGMEQPEAAGGIDIDLSFTPATNLVAIRRLALGIGQASDAPAAWLRFPEFTLERLEQHYHRLALDTYAYQAPGVGYAASLQVSDRGFVTHYPGFWEQEVTGSGHLPA
jgi:hypothetical protein